MFNFLKQLFIKHIYFLSSKRYILGQKGKTIWTGLSAEVKLYMLWMHSCAVHKDFYHGNSLGNRQAFRVCFVTKCFVALSQIAIFLLWNCRSYLCSTSQKHKQAADFLSLYLHFCFLKQFIIVERCRNLVDRRKMIFVPQFMKFPAQQLFWNRMIRKSRSVQQLDYLSLSQGQGQGQGYTGILGNAISFFSELVLVKYHFGIAVSF